MASGRQEQEFVLCDWLAEGIRGMTHYGPQRAGTLMRELCRTVLLADRALVDKVIEHLEGQTEPKAPRRIKVE